MKVLFLTHQYFPRHVGGTEVYTRGLVRRLVAAGHEVEVITCHENGASSPAAFGVRRTEHEGVPLVEVHFNLGATAHPARCEYDNAFPARTVKAELERFRPDLVHATHALKLSGRALHACYEADIPVVVTLCDYWFLCPNHTLLTCEGEVCQGPGSGHKCAPCLGQLHGFARPESGPNALQRDLAAIGNRAAYLRETLLRARRIVALSHFQKRMFVANGFPAERIEVIEHGLDPLELTETRAAHAAGATASAWLRRIGFVGSLVRHKGPHVLLEGLALAPQLDVECLVYGVERPGDAYCRRLRELAQRDPRVRLRGGFQPHELGSVLGQLDLLAAPALWFENDPLVVKAALQLGTPVLASRLGTLAEMVAPRGAEWLVEAGNVSVWAAALTRLTRRSAPRFSPVQMKSVAQNTEEMIALYGQVLGACA